LARPPAAFDALLQQAAVGFELRFARPAQADGTTALAVEMGPAAHQARRHVAQLRQLHLQLAFVRARALRKDVEDQPGAIHHAARQRLLQVALLHRAQAVVDQHQVGAGGFAQVARFLQLAAADEQGRVGTLKARCQRANHAGTSGTRQFAEFVQHGRLEAARRVWLDQQGLFAPF
jgi:hypothetical protein